MLDKWKELALREANSRLRSEYGSLASLFAEKASCKKIWQDSFKQWNMPESQLPKEWTKQAAEQGRQKGEEIGIKKGEKGSLIQTLTVRLQKMFGEQGTAQVPVIKKIDHIEQLRELVNALITAMSIDEMRDLLSSA